MLLRWKQSQSDSVTCNTLGQAVRRAFGEQLYTYIMSNLMLLCLNTPVWFSRLYTYNNAGH